MLIVAGGLPAFAQTAENTPWVELETTSVALGIGGQSGDGVLRLPNLGTNCAYPFKVDGFGAGIKVGISKVTATGPVAGMIRVADLAGDYGATEGSVTLIAGAGGISMKNRKNNVVMNLKSETQGLDLGFGAQGMTIKFQEPPLNAQRAYVVEFGFNKTWVGQEARDVLNQVVAAWKCRPVNIWLFGFTDSVGHEDANLELSSKRAEDARDYLAGAGIVPARVFTQPKGEDPQLARTADSVRLRTNRAVVLVVQ